MGLQKLLVLQLFLPDPGVFGGNVKRLALDAYPGTGLQKALELLDGHLFGGNGETAGNAAAV
jgi:hypothetical protein